MNRGAVKVGISLSNRFSILNIFKGIVGQRGWDYLERRNKLRTKCRIEASLFYGTGLMGAEIRDVSVSGVQVVCRGRVPRGAEVELRGLKLYHQAEFHTVRCVVRWSRKDPQGSILGLEFLDSFEEVAQSWLAWELKANNVKVILARQRRRAVRVDCLLPARLITARKQLQARVLNLSPHGALIQSQGRLLEPSEKVAVSFGPIGHLRKLLLKGWIANVHISGAPTYGVEFAELDSQEIAELKRYLDFFREDAA